MNLNHDHTQKLIEVSYNKLKAPKQSLKLQSERLIKQNH